MAKKVDLLFFLVFHSVVVDVALSQILWEENSDGFSVYYGNVLLLAHSASENPLVSLGIGDQFSAIETLGNYEIEDTIAERFDLTDWQISQPDPGELILTLSYSGSDTVGIILSLRETSFLGDLTLSPDFLAFSNEGINRFFLSLPTSDEERLWGGGEQYTYLNLRGRDYPIWVREQGVFRDPDDPRYTILEATNPGSGGYYHTTYWPQASFLSSRKYYFELTTPTYAELRFAPPGQSASGHVVYWHRTPSQDPCSACQINFVLRNSLMEIVQAINPGAPPLPDWVYNGAILGVQGGTDKMLGVLEQADEVGAAVSGLWIQDWSGKIQTNFGSRVFWNWRWNETWYPELDSVIANLRDTRDIRVLAYITGHLNVEGDVYAEASARDELWLKDERGERLVQDFGEFNVATIDLIEPDPSCNCINPARTFYKDLMRDNLLDLGISGWMADFGEYTPVEARSSYAASWWGPEAGEVLHQLHSQHWASLNRELLEENGKLGDVLFWMRAGGVNSKLHQTMSWAGDQVVEWSRSDGLKSSLVAALSLATGGFGLSHSDVGGYTTIPQLGLVRTKELLLRWAEYSAFTPIMRTHEGNFPQVNHQVYSDQDTFEQFGRLTRIYAALAPYTREAVDKNAFEGIPVMQPLFLQYEDDTTALDQEYEYMYGDDLLVAPVTEPGIDTWQVYLPGPETWVWLWDASEVVFVGPATVQVRSRMGETPVFYRRGSQWTNLFRDIRDQFSL